MQYTIEQARILAGLTQVETAEKLGMSEKTYIQYEKYRRVFKMNDGMAFAKIVGMKLNQIIFFEGQLQMNCRKKVNADAN